MWMFKSCMQCAVFLCIVFLVELWCAVRADRVVWPESFFLFVAVAVQVCGGRGHLLEPQLGPCTARCVAPCLDPCVAPCSAQFVDPLICFIDRGFHIWNQTVSYPFLLIDSFIADFSHGNNTSFRRFPMMSSITDFAWNQTSSAMSRSIRSSPMPQGKDQLQTFSNSHLHRGFRIEHNSFTRFLIDSFIADVTRKRAASVVFELNLPWQISNRSKHLQPFLGHFVHR